MRAFLDTNVLIYAYGDEPKRVLARRLIDGTPVISVQCLNEFAVVSRRKQQLSWIEIARRIALIRQATSAILPLTEAIHTDGLRIAERYQLQIYDGMIVAAALSAGCDRLWSEDLQHGLMIDGRLEVADPFR